MNYCGYNPLDMVNGKGVRVSLFVSGCEMACDGCFSKKSWDVKYGKLFGSSTRETLFTDLNKPYVTGLSILGGNPTHQRNIADVVSLCKEVKSMFPDKTIWVWSGHTLEQIQNDLLRQPILDTIDVLVDGKFVQELSKNPPPFRGSSNQRIIHLENGVPVLFE